MKAGESESLSVKFGDCDLVTPVAAACGMPAPPEAPSSCRQPRYHVVLPSRRRGTLNLATTRGNSTRIQCKTTILSNQFRFFTLTPCVCILPHAQHVQFQINVWQIYRRRRSNDWKEGFAADRQTSRRMAYSWDNRVDFIVRFLYG